VEDDVKETRGVGGEEGEEDEGGEEEGSDQKEEKEGDG
jgi:hypothetical protein